VDSTSCRWFPISSLEKTEEPIPEFVVALAVCDMANLNRTRQMLCNGIELGYDHCSLIYATTDSNLRTKYKMSSYKMSSCVTSQCSKTEWKEIDSTQQQKCNLKTRQTEQVCPHFTSVSFFGTMMCHHDIGGPAHHHISCVLFLFVICV
jgi:hypothetical protein